MFIVNKISVFKNLLFLNLQYLLFYTNCLWGEQCFHYGKVNYFNNCGGCGICFRIIFSNHGFSCVYNMTQFKLPQIFFLKSRNKCKPSNFCLSEEAKRNCKNQPCVPFLAAYKCKCDNTKFGRLCESDPLPGLSFQDYAVVNNILYSPFFVLNEHLTISILFSSLGRNNFEVHVESLLEEIVFNLAAVEQRAFDEQYCESLYPHASQICTYKYFNFKSVKWILNIRLFFPARGFRHKDRPTIPVGNTTVDMNVKPLWGYVELVKLYVYNNKDTNPIYHESISSANFHTSPTFSLCQPTVTIRQGSDTTYEIVKFAKREELIIANVYTLSVVYKGDVPVVCFESVRDFTIHWKVWKHGINFDELTQKPEEEKLNVPHLIFKRYSYEIGRYKVLNNISLLARGRKGFSVAYSFFEVVELDLEPVIQGGDMKNVYYKTKYLKLNASTSSNPNLNSLESKKDLEFKWKCNLCSKGVLDDNTITYYGPFEINKMYIFTLTITSQKYRSTKTTVQKIIMTPEQVPMLDIYCKKNCGFQGFLSNPAEEVYMQVIISYPEKTVNIKREKSVAHFTWTYRTSNDENYQPVENIRQHSSTPSDILIVQQNALTAGGSYVFRVEGGHNLTGRAEFNITMANTLQTNNFSCSLEPNVKVEDSFRIGALLYKISCDRLVIHKLSPKYEFYDRYTDREDLGRLITSGSANVAKYVGISRGKLFIEVTDRWGLVISTFEIVRGQAFVDTAKQTVQRLLDFLEIFHSTVDPEYKANIFSMVADCISRDKNEFGDGSGIIKSLLKRGSEQDIYSYVSMKLWANSVNILSDIGFQFGLDSDDLINLSKLILKISGLFLETVKNSYDILHEYTTKEILHVSQMIIDSCNVIYSSRYHDLERKIIRREDIYEVYFNYRSSIVNMFFSINEVLQTLSLRFLPYLSPLRVVSMNITLWVKEGTPNSFVQLKTHPQNDPIPSVEITPILAHFLNGLSEFIKVKVVVYNGNPFWWDTDLAIITNVVSLEIEKSINNKKTIGYLYKPVRIHLDYLQLGETIIEGSVQQPDPKDPVEADNSVNVYKIRVKDPSGMRLVFHNLNDGETIRIQLLRNLRPDYVSTIAGHIINKSNPEYHNVLQEPSTVGMYDLDFLGILPGPEVPIGKWLRYNFTMSIIHCASWGPIRGWSSRACEAKDINPVTKQLVCECKHLSTFAGFSTRPRNKLNPFQDFSMVLEITDNPFVAVFIICLLLLFLPILLFSMWKSNRNKQFVIYLDDNIPHDQFPYLVIVYTGSRLLTGTTSNVGIVVEGEETVSRPHILRSSKYRTLERGDDNWFIMYTPHYLGKLNMIQLWTDYSGRRPEWYLYKIIVIDITTSEQFTFFVNDWLSLRFGNFIERFVKVNNDDETKHMDLFDEDFAFGFRETHLWFSVIATHPRSALHRSGRVSVAFCALFVIMSVSCMFYSVLDIQEERSEFSITKKQILVGAIGWLVVVIFLGFILTIFRASLQVHHSHKSVLQHKNRKRNNPNILLCLFHTLQKWFLGKKYFVPVHCGKDIVRSNKFIKSYTKPKCTYFATYLCISIILICSLFIVMHAMKFGRVKCLEWLSSVVLSLAQDIFLISPLKITIFTAISVMMYSTVYEVNNYDIDWKRVKIHKKRLTLADPEVGVKLIIARSKKIYVPLSYKDFIKKLNKQGLYDAVWMLLDILVIGMLATMLIVQSNTLWTTKFYWNNYQLVSLLRRGFKEEGYQLSEANDVVNYLPTLRKNVFPLIYQTQWYNSQPLREPDSRLSKLAYTFDGAGTLFGVPRIRQQRLKSGLCTDPIYNGLSHVCPNTITKETQDSDIYSEGWESTSTLDSVRRSSVWDYRNASETFDLDVFGYSDLKYDGGGYVADLGHTQAKTEDKIYYLEMEKWLDRRTVVIIFEITIYNPNAGTISLLISVTERLQIGLIINKCYVYTADQKYNVFLIDIVVFISMCAFIVRLILVLNRRGIKHLFFDFWNRFEIMIIVLSIYCAVLYMKNNLNTKKYLKEFHDSEFHLYFKFLQMIAILSDIELVFVVMFIMVMCRFVKSWRFGKTFERLLFTLWLPWQCIAWVIVLIFLVMFTYWKMISYLLNTFLVSRTFFLLMNRFDFEHTVRGCSTHFCELSLYILCVTINYFLLMIVIHYLWSYKTIKKRTVDKEVFNLRTVLRHRPKTESYMVHRN